MDAAFSQDDFIKSCNIGVAESAVMVNFASDERNMLTVDSLNSDVLTGQTMCGEFDFSIGTFTDSFTQLITTDGG